MNFTLDILRDYSNATPRDLARLRGNKRTVIQMLRRISDIRLMQLNENESGTQIEIAFHTDCQIFCTNNDRRLGNPLLDHIGVLKALYKDAKELNETYKGIEKDLPVELKVLLEEETLPDDDGGFFWMARKPSTGGSEASP